MKEKEWTGERLETFIFNDNTIEHLHRYAVAISLIDNKTVLDIACGEGYGSNLLAEKATNVIGVDICVKTIENASVKYIKPNLQFLVGSTSNIPITTNSIDVVVSFETIEHHDQHEQMLEEIARVLKPTGLLLISSPDKKNYSDLPGNVNPHHVKELYLDQFKSLINKYFKNTSFYYQKMTAGSIFLPERSPSGFVEYSGNYTELHIEQNPFPIYNIALASNQDVIDLPTSIFSSKQLEQPIPAPSNNDILIKKIKQSYSYRIGHLILAPIRFCKKAIGA